MNFHTSCHAHEILKQVFTKYKVMPDWETAINSQEQFFRIDVPAITLHGDKRNLMDPQPTTNLHYIPNQRAAVRVRYTTFKAEYTKLPKIDQFPWEEVNITSATGGDDKQLTLTRHRLRAEKQVEEKTAQNQGLKDLEFWLVSKDHVTRLINLGIQLSDSPSRSLAKPLLRIRTPSPREDMQDEEFIEEPKHLEPEERGEIENLEVAIRQSRMQTSAGPRLSAVDQIYPPRSRSMSSDRVDRNLDRSRSKTKIRPAAGPSFPRRAPRRQSPSPELWNPSLPAPAPASA